VSKALFIPVSVLGGIAAGLVGRKVFERVWALIDSEGPPDPKDRNTTWVKLFAALALEGAIFRAVRGLFDHGSRRGFARLTGAWPGEARPEPE
jgi:Protein of unknown function (DUF4235)